MPMMRKARTTDGSVSDDDAERRTANGRKSEWLSVGGEELPLRMTAALSVDHSRSPPEVAKPAPSDASSASTPPRQ